MMDGFSFFRSKVIYGMAWAWVNNAEISSFICEQINFAPGVMHCFDFHAKMFSRRELNL